MKTLGIFILLFTYSFFALSRNTPDQIDDLISNAQYQKALSLIRKESNKSKELVLKEALCYKFLREYPKAITLLEDLSVQYTEDIPLKLQLASCYEVANLPDKAINSYNELIAQDSANIYFRVQRADLLYQLNDYKLALEQYYFLQDKSPSSFWLKRTAMCFEKLDEPDSAKIYYSRAYDADTTDNFSLASLINIDLKQENYRQALTISDAFITKDSTNKQINLLNALSYYALNRYDEAVEKFEKCRAIGDSSLIVNKNLGIAYYYLGDTEKAYPYLKQAYAQDTTNNNVLYALASSRKELGYTSDAIKDYNLLLERVIPKPGVLYAYYKDLADCFRANEQYKDAVDNDKRALKYTSFNQSLDILYTIADIYHLDIKDNKQAILYYNKYIEALRLLKEKNDIDKEELEHINRLEIKASDIVQELQKNRM